MSTSWTQSNPIRGRERSQHSLSPGARQKPPTSRSPPPTNATARVLAVGALLLPLGGCTVVHMWHGTGATPAASQRPAGSTDLPLPARSDNQSTASSARGNPADASGTATANVSRESRDSPQSRRSTAAVTHTALEATEVGYYIDVLQGRLTQSVGKDTHIERHGDNIVLLVPVGFEVNTAQVNASGREVLHSLAAILREYRLTAVILQVRAVDSDPRTEPSRLAADRLKALSRCLTDAGVAGKRIEAGDEMPPALYASGGALEGPTIELQLSPISGSL